MQARIHVHYILACLGPYLGSMGSDQGDRGIYGILVTYPTSLSTYCHLSTQASMHAHYIFACLGPYLSSMGPDQGDRGM